MPVSELKFAHQLAVVDHNHDGMLCGYGMDRIFVKNSLKKPAGQGTQVIPAPDDVG